MTGVLHLSGISLALVEIAMGAGVGFLIGLTGLGSGSLLTPLLILGAGFSPAMAVGTSLVFSCLTKFGGSIQFLRRGLVRYEIVRDLALGGLPGVLLGVLLIHDLGVRRPGSMDSFMLRAIGAALIFVSAILFLRLSPERFRPEVLDREFRMHPGLQRGIIMVCGFVVGGLVSVTSIGAGAALMPVMVLCYRAEMGALVGSNVFASAFLAAVAAMPHARLGNVSWIAVGCLLAGSLPAMWIAGHMHGRVPRHIPEGLLAVVLLGMGIRIIIL
ncbi:MAG TPA: sulfite exporter TauE/SafE family protein [Candidatus Solibacter sp.]|nr:sulfite exporter TauE/SafE family protein [Candidatus Solibacter sp.]